MSSSAFAGDEGFTRRHKHEDVHIDFTPMIDCMFLLLMFNMIAYTLTGGGQIKVPTAKFAKGVDAPDATVIAILAPARESEPSTLLLGGPTGKPVSLDQARSAIADAAKAGKKKVVIKAEKTAPYRAIAEVARLVGQIDGGTILLAVEQPR